MDDTVVVEKMVDILGFEVPDVVAKLVYLGIVVLGAFIVSHLIQRTLRALFARTNVPSASIFINVVRAFVWFIALLSILRPLFGIEPTGFIAALGVTSVALSLGLQDTISNLFGGFTLMVGKVVELGDVIDVGGVTGEVTDITWRSTTVREFNGDVRIIPNSVLSTTSISKLAPFQAGEYRLPVMLAKDVDLVLVRAQVEDLAKEALGEYFDEEFGAPLFIDGYNNFGMLATISLHTKPGIGPSKARTFMAEAIAGAEWLA